MGKKSCRGFCRELPDVIHRPWWRPRLVRWLYCPVCGVSFPDLRIYYRLDKFGRKVCICCGTNLRVMPRRSKRWKEEPLYKDQEPPAAEDVKEEVRREVILQFLENKAELKESEADHP